ncbi:MAG TPA: NUDIX domain-containing protein, partial [Candidatus Binataceae bacterium]|nr:NUDIX domain-containing protein [Candidatus Binataceae bacterium]
GDNEDPLSAARREFAEETAIALAGDFAPLAPIRQKGGKWVYAWMVAADFDAAACRSNTFRLEWPPRSGVTREFPEVDRAQWFPIATARRKILGSQLALLDELERRLNG